MERGGQRWFDESMLDCCEPLEKVQAQGITFGKVDLAHCVGASVEAFWTNQTSIDDFQRHVVSCASSENRHLIASYHMGLFKQKVAEVRMKEGVDSLSKEEKTRLDMKGELLQLVHETELYKHVSEWLASAICCCKGVSSPCENQNEIVTKVCSQGVELLAGRMGSLVGSFCCKEICVECLKINGLVGKLLIHR